MWTNEPALLFTAVCQYHLARKERWEKIGQQRLQPGTTHWIGELGDEMKLKAQLHAFKSPGSAKVLQVWDSALPSNLRQRITATGLLSDGRTIRLQERRRFNEEQIEAVFVLDSLLKLRKGLPRRNLKYVRVCLMFDYISRAGLYHICTEHARDQDQDFSRLAARASVDTEASINLNVVCRNMTQRHMRATNYDFCFVFPIQYHKRDLILFFLNCPMPGGSFSCLRVHVRSADRGFCVTRKLASFAHTSEPEKMANTVDHGAEGSNQAS